MIVERTLPLMLKSIRFRKIAQSVGCFKKVDGKAVKLLPCFQLGTLLSSFEGEGYIPRLFFT